MKVSIVLNRANRSWIIEKIATRLAQELAAFDVEATVSESAEKTSDIVHHMSWAFANTRTPQLSTMFITHLDDSHKIGQVCSTLHSQTVNVGICMSSDTRQQLLDEGVKSEHLTFISPAHDAVVKPRRIVLGLTTRLYPDGRKREQLLLDVTSRMNLEEFEFRIFGAGWEKVVPELERAGAIVLYQQETSDYLHDYSSMLAAIPGFDYYIYLGMDEGSLGTLDALASGVKTIITPQGFHLDLVDGITHPVLTSDDLEAVLRGILDERQSRITSVQDLTWKAYAKSHLELWTAMRSHQAIPHPSHNIANTSAQVISDMKQLRQQGIHHNAMSLRRILSRVSHMRILRPLRHLIDRLRLKR